MLKVTQLSGFGGVATNKVLNISYVDGKAPASGTSTTFTFTSVNFGAAASDRDIFVVITAVRSTSDTTISSATIGGVTASIGTPTTSAGTTTSQVFIIWATVPSGTSGTVVVNFAAGVANPAAAFFRVTGRDTTGAAPTDLAYQADSGAATTQIVTGLDVLAKGAALFAAYVGTSSRTVSSVASSNLTWNIDADLEYTLGFHSAFGHSSTRPSALTGESVTVTYNLAASSRLTAIWAIR